MNKVRVVIVDDSKLIQSVLHDVFSRDARFEVVGIADNPHDARQVIKTTDPDVITLDVEMPKMNGIAFLRNLMRLRPMPVVMISTLTAKGAGVTLEALELGAVDFIEKPADLANSLDTYSQLIGDKVYQASKVSKLKLLELQQRLVDNASSPQTSTSSMPTPVRETAQVSGRPSQVAGHRICAIGGSTGGLEALSTLLRGMTFSGKETIVVCLHLPAGFTASYARRLDGLLPLTVKEGEHGERLNQGVIYIAPGGFHMAVRKRQNAYAIEINDDDPVNRHKPSVDVLFESVASNIGANSMGILLTGMGKDGAAGLRLMYDQGCATFAQDEATSVVWGMPGSAFEMGAVDETNVLPLTSLSQRTMSYYRTR